MKNKKPLYFIIAMLTLGLILSGTYNASAIIPKVVRTIPSMTIYKDSTSNPVTTLNSINGYQSTPIVQEGFQGNYLSYWKPTFNLNQSVSLSRTRKFLLSFEINAVFDAQTEFAFNCPQGDYSNNFQIAECLIRDVEDNILYWEGEQKFVINGNGTVVQSQDNTFSPDGARKTYFVDLIIYHDSDDLYSTNNIPLRGRFISFNSSTSALHAAAWQIIYTQSLSFEDDEDPLTPYVEAQTIAINDNFQDLFDKLDELLDKETEQETQEQEDRDNIDQQQTDISDDAASSTQDMQSATTNITGIMSAFLGNLNNLNRNNCTLPEITAYGFSLGRLNLCTFSPPNWVQNVTSAVVSLIVLGMAVHVFKRIMRIAKGIAGSK